MAARYRSRLDGLPFVHLPLRPWIDVFERETDGGWLPVIPGALDQPALELDGTWPDPNELGALRRIHDGLRNLDSWSQWVGQPVLSPEIEDIAHLSPFEVEVEKQAKHLDAVCAHPRMQLRSEDIRLPVSRARRTPIRAVADLLARPQDWEQRTLQGVRPARVLARIVDDDCNIYENRVAARLVDHLLDHYVARQAALEKLKQLFVERFDLQKSTESAGYRRRERLFRIWGEPFQRLLSSESEGDSWTALVETLKTISMRLDALRSLLGSRLYKGVPRYESVPLALKATNILVNDVHYRRVAHLWRRWAERPNATPPTAAQEWESRRHALRTYRDFVRLVFVRALHELGVEVVGTELMQGPIELTSRWGSIRFEADASELRLDHAGRRLRVIPVLAELEDGQSKRWPMGEGGDAFVILAVPCNPDRSPSAVLSKRMILELSAWSLLCVEATGRLVSLWLSSGIRPYPARTSIKRATPPLELPRWLTSDGRMIALIEPPRPNDKATFKGELERVRAQHEEQNRRMKGATRTLDRSLIDDIDAVSRLVDGDDDGALTTLGRCALCGQPGRWESRGSKLDERTWWCRCINGACGAEWGIRRCPECTATKPIVIPDVDWRPAPGDVMIGAAAQVFGLDLWSEICPQHADDRQSLCWNCGACGVKGCRLSHSGGSTHARSDQHLGEDDS